MRTHSHRAQPAPGGCRERQHHQHGDTALPLSCSPAQDPTGVLKVSVKAPPCLLWAGGTGRSCSVLLITSPYIHLYLHIYNIYIYIYYRSIFKEREALAEASITPQSLTVFHTEPFLSTSPTPNPASLIFLYYFQFPSPADSSSTPQALSDFQAGPLARLIPPPITALFTALCYKWQC